MFDIYYGANCKIDISKMDISEEKNMILPQIEVGKSDKGGHGKGYSIGNNIVMVGENGVIQVLNR